MVPALSRIVDTVPVQHSPTLVRRRPRLVPQAVGATVEFGVALRRQCDELARAIGSADGVALSCDAQQVQLPATVAAELALVALGLIASASASFAVRRHARIGVMLRATANELELTVEQSGLGTQAERDRANEAARLEQKLVARLGGRIDCPRVIGGVRIVVTLPRP